MTQIDEKEASRRAKISAARRSSVNSVGDRGVAAREAKLERARAFYAKLLPVIDEITTARPKWTYQFIADELNRRQLPAMRGGAWSPKQVERLILSRPS